MEKTWRVQLVWTLATVSRDVQAPCICRVCVLVAQTAHTCIKLARTGDGRGGNRKPGLMLWERCSKAGDTSVEIGSPAVFFCSKIFI